MKMQVCGRFSPRGRHAVPPGEENQPCTDCGHDRVWHPGDEEYKAGFRDGLREAAGLLWQDVEKRIREIQGG